MLTFRVAVALGIGLCLVVGNPGLAHACGIYIPRDSEASMDRERGLIIWDGVSEKVLMEVSVTSEATEAAWIFPSPSPATVALGEAAILDELDELTKPQVVVEHRWGFPMLGAGSAAPPEVAGARVTVLSQQTLGPFEVTTLAATDADALSTWLSDNGYNFPTGLEAVLQPYVEREWFYVAARLSPEQQDEPLTGQLDPLWITFASTDLVYTMRPAAMAPAAFPLTLYVVADHRVEKATRFGASEVAFAGVLDPAALASDSALKPHLPGTLFLTKFRETIIPAQVNDDFTFTFAASDEPYREVIYDVRYDDYSWIAWLVGGLACLMLIGVGGFAFLIARLLRPGAAKT